MRRVRGLSRISLSYNTLPPFSADASIYGSFSPLYNAALVEAALFFYKSGYVYNGKYEPSRERVHTEGPEYGAECIAALERYIQRDYLMRRIMLDYSPRRRTLRHANTYSAEKKVAGVLKREIDTEDRSEAEFEALRRTIEGK